MGHEALVDNWLLRVTVWDVRGEARGIVGQAVGWEGGNGHA